MTTAELVAIAATHWATLDGARTRTIFAIVAEANTIHLPTKVTFFRPSTTTQFLNPADTIPPHDLDSRRGLLGQNGTATFADVRPRHTPLKVLASTPCVLNFHAKDLNERQIRERCPDEEKV